MAITQFVFKNIKMGEEVSAGVEPTYAVTVPDTEVPGITIESTPVKVNTNAGEKAIGYDVKVTVPCLDPIGNSSVEALLGKTVWIHGEPDGTISSTNPAITVKSVILNKSTKITGSVKDVSRVTYEATKTVVVESDAWVKDTTA